MPEPILFTGNEACPKCGSVIVGRNYDSGTDLIRLTCQLCGAFWMALPLDHP